MISQRGQILSSQHNFLHWEGQYSKLIFVDVIIPLPLMLITYILNWFTIKNIIHTAQKVTVLQSDKKSKIFNQW